MTYTINTNTNFNSLEISFDHKPSEKVLEALKALRFRWHRQKAMRRLPPISIARPHDSSWKPTCTSQDKKGEQI